MYVRRHLVTISLSNPLRKSNGFLNKLYIKLKRTRNASNFECIFSSSTNDIHLELLLCTRTRKWQYVKSDSHTSSFWQKLKKRHIGAPKEKWPFSFSEKSEPKKKRRRLSERQSVKFPTEKYADKWHIFYLHPRPLQQQPHYMVQCA